MRAKRVVDIVIGSVLAVAALPMIAVLAAACWISLRSWPFFVQRRVGKDGREFSLPKLRTLPRSVPTTATKYELDATVIPPFCQFLRRTHLDELPQLLVVPLGWMSLVGPRPEMPSLLAMYPAEFATERSLLRPGCTGLWQVSSSSGMLIHESPEYDRAYVQGCSVLLDFWIMYRTLLMTLAGRSQIGLADVPEWMWSRRVIGASGATELPTAVASPPRAEVDLVLLEELEGLEALRGEADRSRDVSVDAES